VSEHDANAVLADLLDATEPGSMTFQWTISSLTRGQLRAVLELAVVGQATLAGESPRLVPAELAALCRQVREAERGTPPAPGTALFRYVQAQDREPPVQRLAAACRKVQASAVDFLASAGGAQVWPCRAVA
jgi:hypothetical protein